VKTTKAGFFFLPPQLPQPVRRFALAGGRGRIA